MGAKLSAAAGPTCPDHHGQNGLPLRGAALQDLGAAEERVPLAGLGRVGLGLLARPHRQAGQRRLGDGH